MTPAASRPRRPREPTTRPPDNLGAHMSIAGGLPQALVRGREAGCSVVQLFLKNQVQWRGRPLDPEEVAEFKRQWATTGIHTVFAHATYLINLAAPDDAEWRRAVDAFHDELERAEALALPFVVIHPGSHKGAGREAGLARRQCSFCDTGAVFSGKGFYSSDWRFNFAIPEAVPHTTRPSRSRSKAGAGLNLSTGSSQEAARR